VSLGIYATVILTEAHRRVEQCGQLDEWRDLEESAQPSRAGAKARRQLASHTTRSSDGERL